jgi:hypothetical protein
LKRHAPATARNSGPIADVLAQELPASGLVLEIASGTGEHALFMASRFPELTWQPSDFEQEAVESIDAWASEAKLANLRPAIQLDASQPPWPVGNADAILCVKMHSDSCYNGKSVGYRKYDACVCINMVHISEWEATVGLFKGCAKYLAQGAPIILYGPYLEEHVQTALSNLAFDLSLKERNPAWGLRKVADVDRLADEYGFTRSNRYEMPANNLTIVYRRKSADGL